MVHPVDTSNEILSEQACAALLGLSIHWLRKDRTGRRIVPFYRIGGTIRYNRSRVLEALAATEEGGLKAQRRAS